MLQNKSKSNQIVNIN